MENDFWKRALNRLRGQQIQSEAISNNLLGRREDGKMPYCTNETLDEFIRKHARDSISADPAIILKKLCRGANKHYLQTKALMLAANDLGYKSVLLTLTCPSALIEKYTAPEKPSVVAYYDYLSDLWSKVVKDISKRYSAGKDFFGLRVTECHRSGLPHWHILLFCNQKCADNIKKKLLRVLITEGRQEAYINTYSADFIKIREIDTVNSGLSYLFKNSYAWKRNCSTVELMDALRHTAAVSNLGKSQFASIGTKGISGIIDCLRKAKNDNSATKDAALLSSRLHKCNKQRGDLKVLREILTNSKSCLLPIRKTYTNKYGEKRIRTIGIDVKMKSDQKGELTCNNSRIGRTDNRVDINHQSKWHKDIKSRARGWTRYIQRAPSIGYSTQELYWFNRAPQSFVLSLDSENPSFIHSDSFFPLLQPP